LVPSIPKPKVPLPTKTPYFQKGYNIMQKNTPIASGIIIGGIGTFIVSIKVIRFAIKALRFIKKVKITLCRIIIN
jgi:hypothetical protein